MIMTKINAIVPYKRTFWIFLLSLILIKTNEGIKEKSIKTILVMIGV